MKHEVVEHVFRGTNLWQPMEFRACLARRSLSLNQFREMLVREAGEIGTPSIQTIRSKWAADGGPGPRNIVLVVGSASVLGCSIKTLLCPSQSTKPFHALEVTESEIIKALQVLDYASRLGLANVGHEPTKGLD